VIGETFERIAFDGDGVAYARGFLGLVKQMPIAATPHSPRIWLVDRSVHVSVFSQLTAVALRSAQIMG